MAHGKLVRLHVVAVRGEGGVQERELALPVLLELRRVRVVLRSLAHGVGPSRVVAVRAILDVFELPVIVVVVVRI